jgi:hypothetical protein
MLCDEFVSHTRKHVINLGNVHAQGLFLCTCREGIAFDRLFYDLVSDR